MVASVPMTPILRLRVARTAARAPGSMTPTTGMSTCCSKAPSATAVEVLHATTSSLMPLSIRKAVFSNE